MALSPYQQKLMEQEQTRLQLPAGFKVFSPHPFAGLDQQASRAGMDDKSFFWLENLLHIGPGELRAAYDAGTPIHSDPEGIIICHFFNIDTTPYVACFHVDGTADQTNLTTNEKTVISSVKNTFYNPATSTTLPACCQSESRYLLISSDCGKNAYWIWDGKILYSAGSISPAITVTSSGSGYTSAPSVTAYGGTGTGISLQAVVDGGSVVKLNVLNPGVGYQPGDQVQLMFSGGGSLGSSPQLTVELSPNNISAINVTTAGSGYAGAPAVTITPVGGGSGATAHAQVINGTVTAIIIDNAGSGYTSTPVVTLAPPGPGGVQATAAALLSAGSVASVNVLQGGSGFTGTPTVQFIGGGGAGAQATATVANGSITAVTVSHGGSGYTSAPAAVVQTGMNPAAAANIELMPYGISGTSLETFQNRIWICDPYQPPGVVNGATFLVSAPDSLTDFATSSGGLIFTSTDRFLRARYTALRQSNGYLYPVGDSSVSVISNVQTGGSPTTTTFNYQNTDPQIGTQWRETLQDFGRTVLFANSLGVYGLYGGAVTKVSGPVDKVFANALFPPAAGAVTPSSAVVTLFNVKYYLLLLTITDPFTKKPRNVMLAWNEKEWSIISQTPNLKYITSQELNSNLTAWGSDGTNIFQLMAAPSSIVKTFSTKLYGNNTLFIQKLALAMYLQAEDHTSQGMSFVAAVDTESGSYPINEDFSFPAGTLGSPMVGAKAEDIYASTLGLTIQSQSLDFSIWNIILAYEDYVGIFG